MLNISKNEGHFSLNPVEWFGGTQKYRLMLLGQVRSLICRSRVLRLPAGWLKKIESDFFLGSLTCCKHFEYPIYIYYIIIYIYIDI